MKAIVSVFGRDKKGIIAKVSGRLFDFGVNVEDISQTIMQNCFSMIMMVDLSEATADFGVLSAALRELGESIGVEIKIQLSSIFDAMHKL